MAASKVETFLDTYKAFVEGAKARGLEDTLTPDTISKGVVSVFIADNNSNGHQTNEGGARPAKQGNSAAKNGGAGGEVQNLSGTIERKKQDKKTSAAGRPYTQYSILVGGKWWNTLDGKVFGGKVFNEGDSIDFTVTQNDKGYWNLTSVELAENSGGDIGDDDIPF